MIIVKEYTAYNLSSNCNPRKQNVQQNKRREQMRFT